MSLTVVILTFNEARHIERCIASIAGVASRICVIDSGSTDATVELARHAGATVLSHPWENYATQFNWALDQMPADTEWVLRLDADEVVTPALAEEISRRLPGLSDKVEGIYLPRRMTFLGQPVLRGGVFPAMMLRLFRHGKGRCEDRWMDEHIKVEGPTTRFRGELIDDNTNSLTWWTDKHNAYASREAIDLLNLEHGFSPLDTVAGLQGRQQAGVKRWIKEKIYARLPAGSRARLYFLYRYYLRLGVLDTPEGRLFHILQGYWYRRLVDAKLMEVRSYMCRHNADAPTAIKAVLKITVR